MTMEKRNVAEPRRTRPNELRQDNIEKAASEFKPKKNPPRK